MSTCSEYELFHKWCEIETKNKRNLRHIILSVALHWVVWWVVVIFLLGWRKKGG